MTNGNLACALSLTALLACGTAAAADDPLAPLAFLAGHCWTTRFEDGRHTGDLAGAMLRS